MPDLFDDASNLEEFHRAKAIERARTAPAGPKATGRCLYCNKHVEAERRWCDKYCAEHWEREG